jgi:hypothetical protein
MNVMVLKIDFVTLTLGMIRKHFTAQCGVISPADAIANFDVVAANDLEDGVTLLREHRHYAALLVDVVNDTFHVFLLKAKLLFKSPVDQEPTHCLADR